MKVLMIRGPKNCGKTTTLNVVCHKLINKGATKVSGSYPKRGKPEDFEVVLAYTKRKGAVIKVAIHTMGDLSRAVVSAITNYASSVDVLIIACREDFKNPMKLLKNYNHQIFNKTRNAPADRAADDAKVARAIIHAI